MYVQYNWHTTGLRCVFYKIFYNIYKHKHTKFILEVEGRYKVLGTSAK